jgi:PEP-CTERM motif-containing protein
MKFLSCFSLLLFWTVISLPATSDAFSRRSSHSEMAQATPLTTHQTNLAQTNTTDASVSAQAVPEPPVLWLMSIGFGLLAAGTMYRRLGRSGRRAISD